MHLNDVDVNHNIYIIVVSQHLYFNNKTSNKISSAHGSSINASESLSNSSSLLNWVQKGFRLVFVLILFPEGIDMYAEKFELQQTRVKHS